MALEQYGVQLTPEEREQLSQLIRSGKSSARIVARARILLKVDEGWNAPQVAAALDISKGTVSSQHHLGAQYSRRPNQTLPLLPLPLQH